MTRSVASLVFLLGCAANGATNIARTGEPLRLEVISRSFVTDSHLEVTSTGPQSARIDRVNDYSSGVVEWRYFQGARRIDEHDYFRLADDQVTAARIMSERQKLQRGRRWMIMLTVASVATMVGGFALVSAGGGIGKDEFDPLTGMTKQGETSVTAKLGLGLAVTGALTGTFGTVFWIATNQQLKKERRATYEEAATKAQSVDSCGPGYNNCVPRGGPPAASRDVIDAESRRLQALVR